MVFQLTDFRNNIVIQLFGSVEQYFRTTSWNTLDQCFSTQITPRPVFPMMYNFWTMDGKTQSLESNLTPLLYTWTFKQKRFGDCLRPYNQIKNIVLTNFVSVVVRKVFLNIPLFFCCNLFEIFQVPLLGREPAVEKPCFRQSFF